MKQLLFIALSTLLCFTAKSQSTPKYLMHTNKFDYNGWKIKKGMFVPTSNNDSFKVKELQWYSYNGINVIYVSTKINNRDTFINFHEWANDGRIAIPSGIAKLDYIQPQSGTIESDEIKGFETTYAARRAGDDLMRYAQIQSTGNTLIIAGLLTSVAGTAMILGDKNMIDVSPYVVGAGGALTLIGWLVNTSANKHIASAGRFLNGIVPINHGKKKVIFTEY